MEITTRKNIISAIVTIVILAFGLAMYQYMSKQKKSTLGDKLNKKERRVVKFQTFESKSMPNPIEIDGRLYAQERINITSKVQGKMLAPSRRMRISMYFEKGDLLYVIDNKEESFNLKAQKSSLFTAITQMMPDIKFDYPESFEKWQQYLSDFDVEKPIKPLPKPHNDQEKYFIAGRNLSSQYYQIKSQETRLAEYNIYAPFSGVITATNIFPGSLISPGQILCSMINTNQYGIAAPIRLEDLQYVKVGQSVTLKADGLDQTWIGKIQSIGSQIDESTQNVPIYISVGGKGLKDGMFLKGNILGKDIEDVFELPKNIFVSPNSIYTIIDSTVQIKEINSIKRTDKNVLITGIDASDKIVTSSLAGLFPGQKVNY